MDKMIKSFILTSVFLLSIVACASFPYKWYVLDLENSKLRGPDETKDVDLNFCAVGMNGNDGYNCIVFKVEEFKAFRKDYDEKIERLKACEQE